MKMNSQHSYDGPITQRPRVFPTVVSAALLLALARSGSLCHCADTQPESTIGLDARHVRTEVPLKLVTDQVFEASVTMKNSGTRPWGDGLKLRSCDPVDNRNWGTTFIYLGQGRVCRPGEEIVLRSFLKAPSTPGQHVFQWRMARNTDDAMFGKPTPRQIVVVQPRPEEAPPKPPLQDPSGKHVLTIDDFEYIGSFKLPDAVDGCVAAFTESGLALRNAEDGSSRESCFPVYTHTG